MVHAAVPFLHAANINSVRGGPDERATGAAASALQRRPPNSVSFPHRDWAFLVIETRRVAARLGGCPRFRPWPPIPHSGRAEVDLSLSLSTCACGSAATHARTAVCLRFSCFSFVCTQLLTAFVPRAFARSISGCMAAAAVVVAASSSERWPPVKSLLDCMRLFSLHSSAANATSYRNPSNAV